MSDDMILKGHSADILRDFEQWIGSAFTDYTLDGSKCDPHECGHIPKLLLDKLKEIKAYYGIRT